ncbi:MAG: hypothetical protein SGILL_004056 [Bacillariaceae sp.]
MSAPAPYVQRTLPNEAVASMEDCRDFLRTGRCKYGASCKYNHPPNVQSGGGMKAPIDPSEPLYPLRPNEPVCQYFVKHGTCKFGQACKFNHPPQMAGTGGNMMNGNSVLVSMPIAGRKQDGTQGHGMWATGNDSGVQILPQRPDEPNCIYFLKNGRCKYGATCRYHHPLNYHDRNGRAGYEENGRPRHAVVQQPKVHYVTSLPPGSMQQGHFVVSDGSVTFLSLDGSTPAHVISIPQSSAAGKDGQLIYTAAPGTVTSSSSSTSIASSYETAVSNLDAHDSSSSLWNRKAASSGAGAGYSFPHDASGQGRGHIPVHGNRAVYVQNVGEGGAANLPRVVSTGSASVYFDANGQGQTVWRGSRSSSFDQTRSQGTNAQSDEMQRSMSVHSALDEAGRPRQHAVNSPMMHARSHNGTRNQRQPGEVDDGLSQMTSALLTMLDTPEEAAAHQAGYDIEDEQEAVTPRMGTRYASRPPSHKPQASSGNTTDYTSHQPPLQYSQPPSYMDLQVNQAEIQPAEPQTSWLPSWQESSVSDGHYEDSQSLDSMQPPQSSNSPGHHNSSHVGLYLP